MLDGHADHPAAENDEPQRLPFGPENQLRVAKTSDQGVVATAADLSIPDLSRAPFVNGARGANHNAIAGRSKHVALEFHCGEPAGPGW